MSYFEATELVYNEPINVGYHLNRLYETTNNIEAMQGSLVDAFIKIQDYHIKHLFYNYCVNYLPLINIQLFKQYIDIDMPNISILANSFSLFGIPSYNFKKKVVKCDISHSLELSNNIYNSYLLSNNITVIDHFLDYCINNNDILAYYNAKKLFKSSYIPLTDKWRKSEIILRGMI